MFEETVQHTIESGAAQHAAEEGGSDFILGHLLSHPVIKLPTVAGIDLSITNHILMMFIASAFLIFLFGVVFRKKTLIPTGIGNALEAVVEYIMKEAVQPYLGHEARTFAPYFLTAFFFILFCNLLGLVPYGYTATGNIGVTMTLAVMTLLLGQYAGIRKFGLFKFYKHIIPSGLPIFIIPVLLPVEIMSLFAKHFALAVRLFANMIGGHITILAIMSIIFIFHNWFVSPLPLLLIIFCSILELLIAFIQAFVFTTLSSVFVGASLSEEH
jgi:F-type H+-transporting ATPase subunit a